MGTQLRRRVVGKSAAYTVNVISDKPGTVFTNKGAGGSVTFTLPTPTRAILGWWYRFKAVVDQNIVVAAPTVDTMVVLNDLAADSLALSTASELIGGEIEAQVVETADGTFKWALSGVAVGHTYTIAT
jgi:hypothetical protein